MKTYERIPRIFSPRKFIAPPANRLSLLSISRFRLYPQLNSCGFSFDKNNEKKEDIKILIEIMMEVNYERKY